MKIAVIARSTTHHFASGGMETHLKNLVEGLVEAGHFVEVITTSYPNTVENGVNKIDSDLDEKGVEYYFIGDTTPGLNPLSKWELIFYKLGFLKIGTNDLGSKNFYHEANKVFHKLDEKNHFDILISQSTSAKYIYPKRKIPIVSISHGTIRAEIQNRVKTLKTFKNIARFFGVDIPKWIFEHYGSNRKFYSRVDLVVAVSNDLKLKLIKDYPLLAYKTVVIYNGVDTKIFKPSNDEKSNNFTILYVGRMDREKGVDILLDAVAILVSKGIQSFKVNLIGKGVHLDEFMKYAKFKGIDSYVNFLGQMNNADIVKYYQQSSVFVFPTRRQEGHPVTLSEAFCCGLPVICTKNGGLGELIDDGVDGNFVEIDNASQIADKIEVLLDDPTLLKSFSNKALKKGLDQFSRDSMVKNYLRELQKVL